MTIYSKWTPYDDLLQYGRISYITFCSSQICQVLQSDALAASERSVIPSHLTVNGHNRLTFMTIENFDEVMFLIILSSSY